MLNVFLKRNLNPTIAMALAMSSLLCLLLLAFRIYMSSGVHYFFLIWNLFLAWIPFFLSGLLKKMHKKNSPVWLLTAVFFTWLVFFPNSPYILTDLFHLKSRQNIPLWYDLVLIISFAWSGLMLGFISLLNIQNVLNKTFGVFTSWLIVILVLFLGGFGIYLGRFERWNSWDILTNPIALLNDILDRLIHPFTYPGTIGVTLLFFTFLTISYVTLFILIKSGKHE